MTERVTLWHPESPGLRITVRPCLLRRLGLLRGPFATSGEVRRAYRAAKKRHATDHAAQKLAEMRDLRGISTTEHEETEA